MTSESKKAAHPLVSRTRPQTSWRQGADNGPGDSGGGGRSSQEQAGRGGRELDWRLKRSLLDPDEISVQSGWAFGKRLAQGPSQGPGAEEYRRGLPLADGPGAAQF
jgi:hypothetical protein